jgi:hypothetical protein
MSAIWRSEKVPVEWKGKVFDAIQARERKRYACRWSDEVPHIQLNIVQFTGLHTASMKEALAKVKYLH